MKKSQFKFITPTTVSRPVAFTFNDIWRVWITSWKIKWAMLSPFEGKYPYASSISHSQIEPNDPLRFFVVDLEGNFINLGRFFGWKFLSARTIINPEIISKGNETQYIREGCMSFQSDHIRKIKRHEIVELKYWTFFGPRQKKFYLYRAALIEHEIDHMDCTTVEDHYRHRT